ncbi:2'-5' RNA ligase family protein [Halomarina ordinaria]|uniref:2'-5' RNA ligase family protein n=1 Tax=Halomarina ordinaria TaxID=3033939 RepID=A0ABD5UF58_9EURY|nr:2'-5' RNA ligase family protein [Halomarina sp. PSRA2]
MYSLNAPLPSRVTEVAADLRDDLPSGVRPRRRPTLVVKRLGEGDHRDLTTRCRTLLADAPACAARLAGLDAFDAPTGPVTHLVVESPGLRRLHDRLCESFDPIEGIEGTDYVPHVTLGRGGDSREVRRFCEWPVEGVEWRIDDLWLWHADYRERVSVIPLG